MMSERVTLHRKLGIDEATAADGKVFCPTCDGNTYTGQIGKDERACPTCKGEGLVTCGACKGNGCPKCTWSDKPSESRLHENDKSLSEEKACVRCGKIIIASNDPLSTSPKGSLCRSCAERPMRPYGEALRESSRPKDIGDGFYLHRTGNDPNGNFSAWISRGANKARKIQTNGNAPAAHLKSVDDILGDPEAQIQLKVYYKTYMGGIVSRGIPRESHLREQTQESRLQESWKTEVHVEGEWTSNALRFATREEAEASGNELLSRWFQPDDSRATESPDPVNYKFEGGKNVRLADEK